MGTNTFKSRQQIVKYAQLLSAITLFLWIQVFFALADGNLAKLPRLTTRPTVAGTLSENRIDLNGAWQFHPHPAQDFWKHNGTTASGWNPIEVPGEWTMQGFTVEKETAAGYLRRFQIPQQWSEYRIKLRCDAVYSLATVWINGRQAGQHEGGFTPFEFDVTELVHPGRKNTIALAVQNESLADILASGTQYAVHQLGGITRKIYLFAIPELNVSSLHVETIFQRDYRDADLRVLLEIAHEGSRDIANAQVELKLKEWPGGEKVEIGPRIVKLPSIKTGEIYQQVVEIEVASPRKWDCEHPNLYILSCDLKEGQKLLETVERRFGFRQVEVRGNRLFVNNHPVKLRGVNRHEAHPLRGRSLTPEIWRKDAELFRNANCNYIRTSHYPPAEEFIEICDELGLFVEEEAPLCWVGHGANDIWKKWSPHASTYLETIVRSTLEMIQRDRSHPSVIIWSLANESYWGPNFIKSFALAQHADPTRPKSFHDQSWGEYNNNASTTQIANYHYPGPSGPEKAALSERPLLFGEYCHLNAYNRHELVTDPGLRDMWGRGFASMWERMYAAQAVLGGALWSGVDDTFFLPDGRTVGYGTWGPIDGWRRSKPEYWHIKKVYSPVRILTRQIAPIREDEPIRLKLENRHDFTNINELLIEWEIAGRTGTATADINPASQGDLLIPVTDSDLDGKLLLVNIYSPRKFLIDSYLIPIGDAPPAEPPASSVNPGPLTWEKTGKNIAIKGNRFQYLIDANTGMISQALMDNHVVVTGGPRLMILPLNSAGGTQMTGKDDYEPSTDTCSNWKLLEIDSIENDRSVIISVKGEYEEAAGLYTMTIDGGGGLSLDYKFTCKQDVNPRQIGMVLDLSADYKNLTWNRKAPWTVYPVDHIGRAAGTARAFVGTEISGSAGPRTQPAETWSHDCHALGTNDFRSTKENIYWASLTDNDGRGILVRSDGTQSTRAWVENEQVRLLVAGYINPGAERFFRAHAALEDKPLKKGDTVADKIILTLIKP